MIKNGGAVPARRHAFLGWKRSSKQGFAQQHNRQSRNGSLFETPPYSAGGVRIR
ncbi:hypothetical protein X971_3168 [Agrobacterium tumefaciens LBA4213 (Ach5)]|nr:hypothetical protein X971_3168 [Agrobacterium tumefaciens LBA4213 (Ach5)]